MKINLQYIDIREVLDELDIDYDEYGKNISKGWIGTECPFCSDESNHLGINIESKTISCFKCGTTGTVVKFLSEKLNSYKQALDVLNKNVPMELTLSQTYEKERAVKVVTPKYAFETPFKEHLMYLQKRGYNGKKLAKKYNLLFVSNVPDCKWKNRIIVPFYHRGRLVTYSGISIDGSNIKYKHLSEEESIIPVKECLFGYEFAQNHAIIGVVEGMFDQMRIGDGCVATMGTNVTEYQKSLIRKFDKAVIVFDGDTPGKISAEKLANDLAPFMEVSVVGLPDGKDPDSLQKDDVKFIQKLIGRR
jgi:DNA primase